MTVYVYLLHVIHYNNFWCLLKKIYKKNLPLVLTTVEYSVPEFNIQRAYLQVFQKKELFCHQAIWCSSSILTKWKMSLINISVQLWHYHNHRIFKQPVHTGWDLEQDLYVNFRLLKHILTPDFMLEPTFSSSWNVTYIYTYVGDSF